MGNWHLIVVAWIDGVTTLFALVLGLVAFVHCALQRADAFPAIGTLQKPAWLALIGVTTLLAWFGRGGFLLFTLIALGAAAFYLLDVRAGLKGLTDGRGW